MRDPILTGLREAVRTQILQAFDDCGYARPREVARAVCAAHPEDVSAIGTRLAEDALTEIARRELKKSTQGRASAEQLHLPGVPKPLVAQLPAAISIPQDDTASEDDGEGLIYKPLAQATLTDVEAHLQLLSAQIAADTRRHRALKELADLARAAGALADAPLFYVLASATALREVA